jgi:hypothetical protein
MSIQPAIPLLGIYSKEARTGTWSDISTPTFMATLIEDGNDTKVLQWMNE